MAAMGTIDVNPKKMKKFYEAYQFFASLLQSNKFKINFRLEAGDIFCFNNRRVLHGRTEFDPNSGNRHLQGYYIERDEFIARLNYFNNLKFDLFPSTNCFNSLNILLSPNCHLLFHYLIAYNLQKGFQDQHYYH